MKKIFVLSLSLLLSLAVNAKPKPELATVFDQVDYLLNQHQQAWLKQRPAPSFAKAFFSQTSFMREASAANFFRSVQHNIEKGQLKPNHGYSMISYTSMMSINGKTTAVSYSFSQRGRDIHFAKQAYVNGQKLQAVYHYNTSGQLLNVKEYQGEKVIQQKMLEL